MIKVLIVLLTSLVSVQTWANYSDFDIQTPGYYKQPGLINEATVDKIMCTEGFTINDHMARMGFIIHNLRDLVDNIILNKGFEEIRAVIMVDIQVLRTHLTAVFPKTPNKVKAIDQQHIQENKITYQRYLLKIIGFTIEIEAELLKMPVTPEQVESQRLKIASLIVKIDETVQEAHDLFRP